MFVNTFQPVLATPNSILTLLRCLWSKIRDSTPSGFWGGGAGPSLQKRVYIIVFPIMLNVDLSFVVLFAHVYIASCLCLMEQQLTINVIYYIRMPTSSV